MCDTYFRHDISVTYLFLGTTDLVLNVWLPQNNYLHRLAKVAVDL